MDRLQTLFDTDNPHLPYVAAVTGGVAIVSGIVLYKALTKKPLPKEDNPPNTAVIYQIQRGPKAPSMSPFPVKLETFCRLAKIPYVVRVGGMSSKGKFPWMEYNGEAVADTEFCIDFLKKKLNIDVNSHLNLEQRGMSKLLQVSADEHLYWGMVYFRWIHPNEYFPNIMRNHYRWPRWLIALGTRNMRNELRAQGIGRHSKDEIVQIMMQDLRALSNILGSKKFMLGDKMCEGDCAVFGQLIQLVCQEDEVLHNILKDNFPNLDDYCTRVIETLWPDWEECCKN